MTPSRRPPPPAAAPREPSRDTRGVELTEVQVDGVAMLLIDLPAPTLAGDHFADMTDAERDVALRVAAGQSNAAIAKARGTHVRTVANQLAALFRKLGVASRAELRAQLARGGS
ncbi:MAG: helix-turn-helix transcriptional regulator [Sandaracinaceae bacterium]|nr:helix-turn-helix transcriptional regulator [Sandaracinaceae bacterium]MBK8592498.1 helix-turn-helix transcriptional regulator [Sandaracinaceae bacterium]MBP7683103.1 helix-turn-helix transcriptional regulator [Deltaproteobacteria bacterium]